MFSPRPIVLCGPSGVGKSTLIKRLFAEFPDKFGFSVSHTSRKPRAGEKNGVDYNFVDRDTFVGMKNNGMFIESAEFSGNLYGTSFAGVKNVLEKGKSVILDIDMQGVIILKDKIAKNEEIFKTKPTFVFIAPPSIGFEFLILDALEARLRGRGTETEESIKNRLSIAEKELVWGRNLENISYFIINDDIDQTYRRLLEVLAKS